MAFQRIWSLCLHVVLCLGRASAQGMVYVPNLPQGACGEPHELLQESGLVFSLYLRQPSACTYRLIIEAYT